MAWTRHNYERERVIKIQINYLTQLNSLGGRTFAIAHLSNVYTDCANFVSRKIVVRQWVVAKCQ